MRCCEAAGAGPLIVVVGSEAGLSDNIFTKINVDLPSIFNFIG